MFPSPANFYIITACTHLYYVPVLARRYKRPEGNSWSNHFVCLIVFYIRCSLLVSKLWLKKVLTLNVHFCMSQTSPSLGAPPIEILVPLSLLRPPLNEPVCSCHLPQLTPAHLYINLLLPFLEGDGAQCNAGGYWGMLRVLPMLCAIWIWSAQSRIHSVQIPFSVPAFLRLFFFKKKITPYYYSPFFFIQKLEFYLYSSVLYVSCAS